MMAETKLYSHEVFGRSESNHQAIFAAVENQMQPVKAERQNPPQIENCT